VAVEKYSLSRNQDGELNVPSRFEAILRVLCSGVSMVTVNSLVGSVGPVDLPRGIEHQLFHSMACCRKSGPSPSWRQQRASSTVCKSISNYYARKGQEYRNMAFP
jgi:hypothetical protein